MNKNFCSEYLILNSGTEIPATFTAWCSLSAVSCVLSRRLWIDMGPFKIYPNMFVILIAGSGMMRKSTAVGVTRDLLDMLSPKPNIVSQKVTPEALLDAVRNSNGKISTGEPTGQGFVITDELTNFLNSTTNEGGIVPMLIDLYDCRSRFAYRTKSRGEEVIRDTQLGMLAATTPEELRRAIPEDAIGSGLASRILFVYESKPAPPIAFPSYSARQLEAKEYCVRFLQRASTFSGEIKLSPEARQWCEECYNSRCYGSKFTEDPHLRGYASRRYIHILKLAICLAVGLNEAPDLTVDILERAEHLIVQNEQHLSRVVQLVTMNEKGQIIANVLALIRKHQSINRQELMRLLNHRLDNRELTEVCQTLINSHQINCTNHGVNIIYEAR